ncbi:MAG: PEP/pyruvate-binding domain-containing protein [bacterium]
MAEPHRPAEKLINTLQERAKELNCLYEIEELLSDSNADLEQIFAGIIRAIPAGWQYPDVCFARIQYNGNTYGSTGDSSPTPWVQKASITIQEQAVGWIEVNYTKQRPKADFGPFLKEEQRLITTIADRLGHFILHKQLREMVQTWDTARKDLSRAGSEWRVVVDLLRSTDEDLFLRISRKMMNHLCWSGIPEAEELLHKLGQRDPLGDAEGLNRPMVRKLDMSIQQLSTDIFRIAAANYTDEKILKLVQKWMQEDRAQFLVSTLINLESTLTDISDAIRRFHHLSLDSVELPDSTRKGVKVAMVRRFLSDQLEFISIAKDYVEIKDFVNLIPRVIHPTGSHGKLGGKSAGLFLASRILRRRAAEYPELADIRIPKTWYITSDGLHNFLHYNNLEDVTEQKYKDLDQVRTEHPHIMHVFKNSHFSPEIVQGLSMALDDLANVPLIVRSSSLLEDRLGAAFSGKYQSLFVANQGTKQDRLESLMDAISEVYASTFHSDPIEYRAERGLLDFHEEMGVLIQEVVGTRVGKYYLPSFAGVAFSNNEFRWSPRIKREDGLVRMVPGLGTRAVDRLSDDYPILIAPGQSQLRVNSTLEETLRYSPRRMDVINLETNEFETVDLIEFLRTVGHDLPAVERLVSVIHDTHITQPNKMNLDFEKDNLVVNFESLISKTDFMRQVRIILAVLQEALGTPVDIEFASDGNHFYLLQCRPQSYSDDDQPQAIPKDIPRSAVVFDANRYISNGRVPDISHIVYVDPDGYSSLSTKKDMQEVGKAVGHLNKILPKHQFILMGPGRWGSRGDIKLGVPVTYSDINNSAILIEIARQRGNYTPDLSFGTHFFQDLVEAGIRYLPLYPDDPNIDFNERFLTESHNILGEVLPEFQHLDKVLHVIDVPRVASGKILKVFMNADLEEAVGILTQRSAEKSRPTPHRFLDDHPADDHWRWRMQMVERLAESMAADEFGVKAMYITGSTKSGTAGLASDIDLLFHVEEGDGCKRDKLLMWLQGWGQAIDELNYLRTGYRTGNLIDAHLITDKDIENRDSYAVKIGAVTDAAKLIPLKKHKSKFTDSSD